MIVYIYILLQPALRHNDFEESGVHKEDHIQAKVQKKLINFLR